MTDTGNGSLRSGERRENLVIMVIRIKEIRVRKVNLRNPTPVNRRRIINNLRLLTWLLLLHPTTGTPREIILVIRNWENLTIIAVLSLISVPMENLLRLKRNGEKRISCVCFVVVQDITSTIVRTGRNGILTVIVVDALLL